MATFTLLSLGPLRLVDSDGGEHLRGRRMELALLAFVARRAPRDVAREELTALLWGERDGDRARHSLRQTLLRLKRVLGPALYVEPGLVRVAAHAIEIDASAFEADVSAGRYRDAVDRWHGDFLRDADEIGGETFSAWLEQERESLRRRYAFALNKLLDDAEAYRGWNEAALLAERLVELRPLDAASHVRLIAALRASGRVADAMARHAMAVAELRDERAGAGSDALVRLGVELERAALPARPSPGSSALLTPDLVGRDAALGDLELAWRGVRTGAAVVLVEGDAGIGKTRLVAEFVRRVRMESPTALVLECRATDTDRDAPWAAARRLLAGVARAPRLEESSNRSLGAMSVLVPSLRVRFPHLAPSAPGDDASLIDAICDVLRLVAERVSIVMCVDDVMRADTSSRDLLLALIRRPASGTMIVLAARGDELAQSLVADEVGRAPAARRVKLQPLSGSEVDRLVASMLELPADERAVLAARLHAESGGNPFYVTELVSALADTGLLALASHGTWTLAADLADRALPLPVGVRGAVRQRLDHLDADARVVLEACALAGTLEADALITATGLTGSRFAAAVEMLITRRFLRASTDAPVRYEPSHELLRRVTCELAPSDRRTQLAGEFRARTDVTGRHELEPSGASSPDDGRRELRARGRRLLSSRRVTLAAACAIGLIAAGGVWQRARSAPVSVDGSRVFVAPFANGTADSTLDPLGTIVADWLAQDIAQTGLVKVVPLSVATGEPVRAGRAGLVVSGSYVRTGDSLRFQAHISDAINGELLQSTSAVTGQTARPLVAVEALRRRTLAAIAPLVDQRMVAWARVSSTPPSYEAYLAFAEGLDAFSRGQPPRGAPDPFLRAYALDTSFTLPLLFEAWRLSGGGQHVRSDSLLRVLARRRESLAPFDRGLLDYLQAAERGDRMAAYSAALAVADIAPRSPVALVQLPYEAMAINRPHQAREILERAGPDRVPVGDNSGYWDAYAHALHMSGDYERQLDVARALRRRDPTERAALSYETRALAALGRTAELHRVLEQAIAFPVDPVWGAPGFRYYIVASDELRAHGHGAAADTVLRRAVQVFSREPDAVRAIPKQRFEMARALYRLGRLDEAKALFESLVATNALASLGDYMIEAHAHLGFIAAREGDSATADGVDRWLRDLRDPYLYGQNTELRGALHALLGQRDEAVRLLHQAMAEGRFFDVGKHVYFEYQGLRGYQPFEEWLAPKG